jgi:uncharacterized glyoxalase superfamily protein PhnB
MTADDSATNQQEVTPFLCYEDGAAAMDWLASAFGFEQRTRWLNDDGTLAHGEMLAGGGLIMMVGGVPGYESPRRHREHCAANAEWSKLPWVIDGLVVQVDDVDAHFRRATAAGATVLSEPEDKGYGRSYSAEDIEGHRWMFQRRPAA